MSKKLVDTLFSAPQRNQDVEKLRAMVLGPHRVEEERLRLMVLAQPLDEVEGALQKQQAGQQPEKLPQDSLPEVSVVISPLAAQLLRDLFQPKDAARESLKEASLGK